MTAPRRCLAIAACLVAAALAGCGADDGAIRLAAAHQNAAAPPLSTAPTEGRLGDATRADAGGEQRLSPGGPVDPAAAAPTPAQRDGVAAGEGCGDAELAPQADNLRRIATATLCLLNVERRDRGLGALTSNARLARAADGHVRDMVANGFFSHDGRDGSKFSDRIRASGYIPGSASWVVGENLAWGTGVLATPRAIVNAWMQSPGHRRNILDSGYREIGVGVVTGNPRTSEGGGATFATEFGTIRRARRASTRSRASRKRRATPLAIARATSGVPVR